MQPHTEIRDFRVATMAGFDVLREDLACRGAAIDRGFAEMCGKLDGIITGQQTIVDLLTQLTRSDTGQHG